MTPDQQGPQEQPGPGKHELAKFMASVVINAQSACWEWRPGESRSNRYGHFYWRGVTRRPSRVSYSWFVGPVSGVCVLHRCDNPRCINPLHLFAGSQKDNVDDAMRKGRHSYAAAKAATACRRGHPLSGENLRLKARGDGIRRLCRECSRVAGRRHDAKRGWRRNKQHE